MLEKGETGRMATYVGELLAAAGEATLMRLLARVGPDVDGQGTSLDEALAAVAFVTCVRSLIGMNTMMSLQIGFAVEALDGSTKGLVSFGKPVRGSSVIGLLQPERRRLTLKHSSTGQEKGRAGLAASIDDECSRLSVMSGMDMVKKPR